MPKKTILESEIRDSIVYTLGCIDVIKALTIKWLQVERELKELQCQISQSQKSDEE